MEWIADPMNAMTIKLLLMLIGGFLLGFYFGVRVGDSEEL